MKRTTIKKGGEWLLDVAKYIATAVVVTSFLGEFTEQKALYYIVGLSLVLACFVAGLIVVDRNEDKT